MVNGLHSYLLRFGAYVDALVSMVYVDHFFMIFAAHQQSMVDMHQHLTNMSGIWLLWKNICPMSRDSLCSTQNLIEVLNFDVCCRCLTDVHWCGLWVKGETDQTNTGSVPFVILDMPWLLKNQEYWLLLGSSCLPWSIRIHNIIVS